VRKSEHKAAEVALLEQLGLRLAVYGFRPKPTGQTFYRNVPGGRWAFHVSFIRHEADFDVTADVAIRLDAIEQEVNQSETGLTEVEKRRSTTMGAELGNLIRKQPLRWTVAEFDDVPAVVHQIVEAFERIGLPYLSAYSDVEAAYRLLASTAPEDLVHAPILGARFLRVIAAAYILGRNGELLQLVQQYEAQLTAEEDPYLSDFNALIKHLGLRQ
jgi:hypothetical protein